MVLGKLFAVLAFVLLFILATIPLQALALIFGGITTAEIILSQLILILTTLAFGSIGNFYSSFISKTHIATGAAQFTSLTLVLFIPLIYLISVFFFDNRLNLPQRNDLFQILFLSTVWLVVITSPTLTAIMTELTYLEEQTFLFVSHKLSNGAFIYFPSPWLGFVVVYLLMISTLFRYPQRQNDG